MEFEQPKSPAYMAESPYTNYEGLGLTGLDYHDSPYTVQTMDGGHNGSPYMGFETFSIPEMPALGGDYSYSSESATYSPARPFTPTLPATSSPSMYQLSAGEASDHSIPMRRHGSPTYPIASIPRSQRYNPIAVASTRSAAAARPATKRRVTRQTEDSDDDEDYDAAPAANVTDVGDIKEKRSTIRRQRIESEQRRRDELRDGFSRLREALPPSNQKASKVSLLDRSTTHIRFLEVSSSQLQTRLQAAEAEVQRLRGVNEALMLSTAERHKRSSF